MELSPCIMSASGTRRHVSSPLPSFVAAQAAVPTQSSLSHAHGRCECEAPGQKLCGVGGRMDWAPQLPMTHNDFKPLHHSTGGGKGRRLLGAINKVNHALRNCQLICCLHLRKPVSLLDAEVFFLKKNRSMLAVSQPKCMRNRHRLQRFSPDVT